MQRDLWSRLFILTKREEKKEKHVIWFGLFHIFRHHARSFFTTLVFCLVMHMVRKLNLDFYWRTLLVRTWLENLCFKYLLHALHLLKSRTCKSFIAWSMRTSSLICRTHDPPPASMHHLLLLPLFLFVHRKFMHTSLHMTFQCLTLTSLLPNYSVTFTWHFLMSFLERLLIFILPLNPSPLISVSRILWWPSSFL